MWVSPEREESTGSKEAMTESYNLILEVTFHPFCHILLVTSQQWGGGVLCKACVPDGRSHGSTVEAAYTVPAKNSISSHRPQSITILNKQDLKTLPLKHLFLERYSRKDPTQTRE